MTRGLSALVAMAFLLFPICAHGKTWLPPEPRKVADHFDVSVEGFAGPVPGIEIIVQRLNKSANDSEPIASAMTDAGGIAHFQNLKQGKYFLSTHLALDNDFVDIVVTKNTRQSREDKIALHWPTRRVLHARSLRGSLASFPDSGEPSSPLEGVKLTLLEGYSGREIGVQHTASDGGFAFEGLSPGLYFLRVEETADSGILRPWGRHDVKGEIPINLDPTDAASSETIGLQIAPCWDCGRSMMYKAVE
jgi:hypothetical protein